MELLTKLQSGIFTSMRIVPCHAMDGVEMQQMQYVSASVQDRVLFVVRSVLEQNSINADVHPESRLVDIGLDSMDMVALMLKVEAEFDLTLPQPEITPENFQSVKTLELMILNQLGPGADGLEQPRHRANRIDNDRKVAAGAPRSFIASERSAP